MEQEHLPQRVMLGALVGGKGYSGGQEEDWMVHLKEDVSAFGMKFEGWRNDGQKPGRWFQPVENGSVSFMRDWMIRSDIELQSDTRQRHPLSASSTCQGGGGGGGGDAGRREGRREDRRIGGGGGGVTFMRLRSGSGPVAFQWPSQVSLTSP